MTGSWLLSVQPADESLRVLARPSRDVPFNFKPPDTGSSGESDPEPDGPEWREVIADSIARLPERDRALMTMLLKAAAPTCAHISATLGMPIGSIGPTRARCLERLSRDPELTRLRSELDA